MAGCPPSAAEMAAIRADVAAIVLNLDCTIQRKTPTPDALGSDTEVWTTINTLKVSMRSPTPAQLQAYEYLIGAQLAWQVNFLYGTDVREQDHLIVGSDTMVVQAILSQQSYSSLATVLAMEVV